MRKGAIALVTGLAVLGPGMLPIGLLPTGLPGPGAPTDGVAYAQAPPDGNQNGDQDGSFRLTGVPLPTVGIHSDDDPEDIQAQLDGLRSTDPGRYRMVLPGDPDQARLAAIQKEPASTLWVTLTTRIPRITEYSDEIAITVGTRTGVECANTEVSLSNDEQFYAGPVPIGLLVDPATVSDSSDAAECMRADTLYVQVAHDPDDENQLPVELTVIEEPSVAGTEQLPEAAETEDFEPSWNPGRKQSQVRGARSFQHAPALSPGRYADTLNTGDVRLYRVNADWGRHVEATVNLAPLSTGQAAQMGDDGLDVGVVILGPNRQAVAGGDETASSESEVLLGARTPTVQYRNRESSDSSVGASALAGPYYVMVTAPSAPGMPNLALPYELDLRVPGDSSGSPQYTGEAAPPDGMLVTDGSAQRSERQGSGDATDTTSGETADQSAAAGGYWRILGPLLIGLVAAVIVLGIGSLLRRRSRTSAG